jgi:trans-aconitate 2-methyltransferase
MSSAAQQQWNPELYQASHSWAWEYGRDLLQFLAPKPGERILDVGCGTGQLTFEISASGAEAIGIDASAEMVEAARKNFPELRFELGDAAAMRFDGQFDAVFSNAALHWVTDQKGAIAAIARALKPGGRFVFEMGGYGNIREILRASDQALLELGIDYPDQLRPWTFPKIGDYAHLLEDNGLRVDFAVLFERPTPLEWGVRGLANWLQMFGRFALEPLTHEQRIAAIHRVEELARPHLFRDSRWVVDYKRLRMLSVKE